MLSKPTSHLAEFSHNNIKRVDMQASTTTWQVIILFDCMCHDVCYIFLCSFAQFKLPHLVKWDMRTDREWARQLLNSGSKHMFGWNSTHFMQNGQWSEKAMSRLAAPSSGVKSQIKTLSNKCSCCGWTAWVLHHLWRHIYHKPWHVATRQYYLLHSHRRENTFT